MLENGDVLASVFAVEDDLGLGYTGLRRPADGQLSEHSDGSEPYAFSNSKRWSPTVNTVVAQPWSWSV